MRTRRLGDSELEVSEISLGSWLTYSGGIERDRTEACTRAAFEADINFFDTANVYGNGAAEEAWGEILSGYDRESFVLATKVFFEMSDTDSGLSREQIHKQIDASLARLQTHYVDLYQCHRFDPDVPIEETMEALTEVVEAGKARYLGFSEWSPEQILAAPEAEVFPLCAEHGISQIVWSPLGQGVLTGKYAPGEPPASDSRAASEEMGWAMDRYLDDRVLEAVQRLRPIADEAGLTMAALGLAWVLRRDEVASAIVGASRPEQVRENAAASGVELSPDTLAAIDDALDGIAVTESQSASAPGITHR